MSKDRKKLHNGLSKQGSLFDTAISEGALDVDLALRDALTRAISQHTARSKDSRYQIAAKVSELTKRSTSKEMLDKYTSSNQDYCFKAADLSALCAVTGTLEPFRVLLEPLGCEVVGPEDSKLLRLTKKKQELVRIAAEVEQLERETGSKSPR